MDSGPRYWPSGPITIGTHWFDGTFPTPDPEERNWREILTSWIRGDGSFDDVMNHYQDAHQEGHELTHAESDYSKRVHWQRGWWLHPFTFGLGFEAQWDRAYDPSGEDVKWASLTIGPVSYIVTRTRKSDRDYEEVQKWASRRP